MKSTITLSLFILLFSFGSIAQQTKTLIEKKVEITDGDEPTVTITKTEDGSTTTTVLTGDKARAYIADHEKKSASSSKSSIIEINISDEDLEAINENMRKVKVEINKEMEELDQRIEEMNFDSIMDDIGIEIERTLDEVKYHFDSENGKSTSVIIMRTSSDTDEVDVDVSVEVNEKGTKKEKKVVVKRTSMDVEDEEDRNTNGSDLESLKVYPVPSTGDVHVSFDNTSNQMIEIRVRQADEKIIREMKLKGSGEKDIKLNLNDLPAGACLIEVKQGKAMSVKKLILE